MNDESQAGTQSTKCYLLRGILCVPSYSTSGIYAYPGGFVISERELERRMAAVVYQKLWQRRV